MSGRPLKIARISVSVKWPVKGMYVLDIPSFSLSIMLSFSHFALISLDLMDFLANAWTMGSDMEADAGDKLTHSAQDHGG
jgi:hypothetical protein